MITKNLITKEAIDDVIFNCLQNDIELNEMTFKNDSKPSYDFNEVSFIELQHKNSSYFVLPVEDIEIYQFENFINMRVLPNFKTSLNSVLSEFPDSVILTKPTSSKDQLNEYYSNFKQIFLKNGVIFLYNISPLYSVGTKSVVDDVIVDAYKAGDDVSKQIYDNSSMTTITVYAYNIEIVVMINLVSKEEE